MKSLIDEYLQAKGAELAAKERRVNLGKQIADQLAHPDEGQKSHKIEGYTVTIKGAINRKVDWSLFLEIADQHDEHHAPFKTKRELDIKGLHWVRDKLPQFYAELCRSITSTPGAPQITVKESSNDV